VIVEVRRKKEVYERNYLFTQKKEPAGTAVGNS